MDWFDEAAELGLTLTKRLERVMEEAERLGAEAFEGVAAIWERLDDLPFVPDAFQMPPIRRQLYAHGAFMGAAPALLADDRWRRILAFLMPDVYADVTEALADGKSPSALIPMFENNPVMAAFGLWRHAQGTGAEGVTAADRWALEHVGLEWDLFLDGELAEAHAKATRAERGEIVEAILRTAVVAHAGALDTLQENLGFCQHDDVRCTPKAALGGVEIAAWLDLFARSFLLAEAESPTRLLLRMTTEPRFTEGDACVLNTFVQPLSAAEAINIFKRVTGRERFSLILDMKSLRSTPALFGELIEALNARGVHVTAACSFSLQEIQGLSELTQVVDGVRLPGPREVLFFHYAGDLQVACDAGTIPRGQSVLFNGASLLTVDNWFSRNPRYGLAEKVVADLARYVRDHELQVGLYVQEGDCDSAAAALLGQLVEDHEDVFPLGFAWGGLPDEVAFEPGGEPRMGYGSQLSLAFVGKAREWTFHDET